MEGLAAYNIFMKQLKRKREDEHFENEKRRKVSYEYDDFPMLAITAASTLLLQQKARKPRDKDKNREIDKTWWDNGYANWSEDDFAKRMRIKRGF